MTKNINPSMIAWISHNWEDRRHAGEVQEMVEAIVAELKQVRRAAQRNGRPDAVDFWESLAADVQDEMFWKKLDTMLHFSFDF